jgi:hypothetical protein
MKRLGFSSLALGTLVGAISGATLSHPIAARAAEPVRLAEAEMERITAGATARQTTGASVTGSGVTVQSRQRQSGATLPGGAVIVGAGVVLGTAGGSSSSGRPILSADASGNVTSANTVGGVVDMPSRTVAGVADVPSRTIVYGVTSVVAIDTPLSR